MDNIEIKLNELRNYAFNINAISDISPIVDLFSEVNTIKLDRDKRNLLSDSLLFMIEQATNTRNEENESKIEIIKDIIKNYIYNNLEVSYYHYYFYIRESRFYERNDIDILLNNLLEEQISFLNEFQKISFVSFLEKLKQSIENKDIITRVIDKIKSIETEIHYPVFAPSKIKQLEEQNKNLEEELANVNYILMMQDMI